MKTLLIVVIVSMSSISMACEITGKVKKKGAKTIYLDNGESISEKQINKLGCKLNKTVMSKRESLLLDISSLESRLEAKKALLKSL
jgi:hypothetical protein